MNGLEGRRVERICRNLSLKYRKRMKIIIIETEVVEPMVMRI